MPKFTSKVQHKNYEKGEFSDEKERGLDDTINLIKTFPFDKERHLTDIQPTGPSVTICDQDMNYLKIGLYFNDKFCIYYLDNDNHLYERPVSDMEEVCNITADFFTNNLNLEKFNKTLFSVGPSKHFITKYFEYKIKPLRVLLLTSYLNIYFLMFVATTLGINLKGEGNIGGNILLLIPTLFFGGIMGYIIYKAYKQRNQFLQISKGASVFSFGHTPENVKTYNKADVAHISCYQSSGSRNPNLIEVYKISFTDGSVIKFSNMLIPGTDLLKKFSDTMENRIVDIIYEKKSPIKVL